MELCIDFGGTEIKVAVVDGPEVVASAHRAIASHSSDLETAAELARAVSDRVDSPVDAVGIAVPGVVDPRSQRMLHANAKYDFLRTVDLAQWAQAQFGLPAIVENDARAALAGEASSGCVAGESDVVLITLGTGIGTAVMMDGALLRGRTGHAGILGGHLTTAIDGPVCPCGNLGCGEALASSWVLAEMYAGSMRDLFAADGDTAIRERFLRTWGAVVTTLIHSYEPAAVVLSGGILRGGDAVSAPIESYVREHLWPSLAMPRFVTPPQPELSVARGLAALARTLPAHRHLEEP
ncbi:ROK family protein [Microbacterium aurum]|uniref:ROK family protein n=1 Tax=Microbacterium aurum TaxID=36805 RepID=UPI001EF6CF11|nr:ROK family protein [Microbacterium aurum]